jgi:sialate O-acetylesterase
MRLLIIIISCLIFSSGFSQVRLPRLISDGMVLQRDTDVKIWGWAAKNEKVTLDFNGTVYNSSADVNGEWKIIIPGLKAGGPFSMTINASNTITVKNIMIGDIWICSGQSNMELPMRRVSPIYESEIANSENSDIRFFTVPQKYDFNTSQKDLQYGEWKTANPLNVPEFSAVAYFFAKELYGKYKIPIGMINASLGGSPVEAWLSEDAIKRFPGYYDEVQQFKDKALINRIENQDKIRMDTWYRQLRQNDEGYKDPLKPWYNPDISTSDWKTIKVPGYWTTSDPDLVNGVVWYRKDIIIPSSIAGKQAKLILGRIVDADSVFLNGVFVGTTGYQYPPRRYEIASGLLKEGKNSIVIRVISNIGNGGFVPDKPYELISGSQTIDLKGDWQYRPGAKMQPLASQTFIRWKPVGLYNAMISPLLNFSIKGAIWYQGESNAERPLEYRTLFPALINNWRDKWNSGDFPFLYVQLANYMEAKDQPSESNWALLREAQLRTLPVPQTGMAVTIDLGEWNDIHPLNKKDVGKRLAFAAQKIAYGNNKIVSSGPTYNAMKIRGNKIILTFKDIGSGLVAKDGELRYFAIAGADNKFVWGKAKIKNDKVIVWSESIPNPVAVRYAWADNPEGANLYNREGLPASPFRTDDSPTIEVATDCI